MQMIEVHHMIMDILCPDHQVTNELGVGGDLPVEGILDRSYRGDAMDQGADPADTLGKGPGITRIPAPENILDATHHRP